MPLLKYLLTPQLSITGKNSFNQNPQNDEVVPNEKSSCEYHISDVQIIPIKPKDGLVGFASVVFNNSFYLGSLAIMTRLDGGYRVVYPKRKIGTRHLNVFHPVNKEISRVIEKAVVSKFESLTRPNEEWSYDDAPHFSIDENSKA
jgi:DNA-binding cell septation regulator SpoVG